MKKWIVYEHVFPNGKRYIGITCKKPNARWENGSGYGKNQPVMKSAIQKYGWDNIEHNILYTDLTEEEAKAKEIELIEFYHTFIHDENCNGYNMTKGGEGATGHKAGEKVARINRERMTGKIGKDCPNSKPVICDGIEFESLTQWKQYYNYPKGNINAWLSGAVSMPKEWYDKEFHYKDTDFSIIKCRENEWVYHCVIDGITFDSQKSLAEYLGVCPASIVNWVKGKHKIPQEYIDRGFSVLERENNLRSCSKPLKISVEYDGVVYESCAEFARAISRDKTTITNWRLGKTKIPQEYIDKGLKFLQI